MSVIAPSTLTAARLRAEVEKCLFCETKPCRDACPAHCSPADFIMAIRVGEPSDFRRAAAMILAANPLGGVCGAVCPDTFCMAACARAGLDAPVNIPAVQATIVARARQLGVETRFAPARASSSRVAIVGAGPAGLAAAALLAQEGQRVELFEAGEAAGGMAALIPAFRMDPELLAGDLAFVVSLGELSITGFAKVGEPTDLLERGYDAAVVATGLDRALKLGVPGEELAIPALRFLAEPTAQSVAGRHVAVIGGGAVAADCAETAVRVGAASVELFALEAWAEMPLTPKEREGLRRAGVAVSGRTRVTAIIADGRTSNGLETNKVELPAGVAFHPSRVVDVPGTEQRRPGFDAVIVAIGARASFHREERPGLFFAGDVENGPTTVVEAVAAGKNTALAVLDYLSRRRQARGESRESPIHPSAPGGEGGRDHETRNPDPAAVGGARVKSTAMLPGWRPLPVPLDTDFFGIPIGSPFLLSAAPPTDGYDAMRRAYEAGWAGGVMKTAFDGVPIHVPARYMFAFGERTFANCDNVSAHALDRVCHEVERLRREFPDRLTLASTGGPVTGDEDADARVWRSNTAKLEAAGALGIEYSLSCPQGGDGTKGDIVSQDIELTAKIVGWVLATGDPEVPKLFKLTAAVTSIVPIVSAIREILACHPQAKAGITLANTFPTLAFRPGRKQAWEEGIVVGMSGEGVAPISYLTLAKVAGLGVVVSGNAGAMDYRSAANFLALGCRTVQFCSVAMKYGVAIVDELHSGLSHLLAERGLSGVGALIGRALPDAITPFGELPAAKPISAVQAELCIRCGNCARCPYQAITLDADMLPSMDPARCVGCSFCTLQCPSLALFMRERTAAEAAALDEAWDLGLEA